MLHAIRTADELRALRQRAARRSVNRIALELVAQPELRARLEKRINRWLTSCGCVTGAAFVAVGMIVVISSAVSAPDPIGPGDVARALGVLLALALVGKMAGLLGAEIRLRRAIRDALRAAG